MVIIINEVKIPNTITINGIKIAEKNVTVERYTNGNNPASSSVVSTNFVGIETPSTEVISSGVVWQSEEQDEIVSPKLDSQIPLLLHEVPPTAVTNIG